MREGLGNEHNENAIIINTSIGIERWIIACLVSFTAGIVAFVGLNGLRFHFLLSIIISLIIIVAGVILLKDRLPLSLDDIRKQKPLLSAAWLVLGIAALVQTARLSVFMADPSQSQYSLFPGVKWYIEHCCLTAYSESARLLGDGEKNIYDPQNYYNRKVAGFNVDLYHYPPPFLLLPLMVRGVTGGDFLNVRAFWFALNALLLLLAMWLLIYRLEPENRLRAIGMAPLIWLSMPVMAGLQVSNVQIMVISISVIAWAIFPRQAAAGGMLLAMSSVAKIFPGILFVHLAAQRKWREVIWTAVFAFVLILSAFLIIGPHPFKMFIEYELPRLSSGEAFSGPFSKLFAVARNMAPFGIPLKLGGLGIPGMTLEIGRIVSMIYLLGIVGLTIWSGRHRPRSNSEAASIWLSLLSLGTLASPFAPASYVLSSLVWLVCINREIFRLPSVLIIWLLISGPFLISQEAPFLLLLICYLPAQVFAVGIPAYILWRSGKKEFVQKSSIEIEAGKPKSLKQNYLFN
jgi:alpha-1,2-mannosyltransferase